MASERTFAALRIVSSITASRRTDSISYFGAFNRMHSHVILSWRATDRLLPRAHPRRRRRLHAIHRLAVAGGAGGRRLARDVRCRDARPRAGLQIARSDLARASRDRRAVAGRVRAGAGGLSEGSQHRAAGRRRAAADGEVSPRADRDRSALRRAGDDRARDLGPRNRLWPLHAALRRVARAGDAGLCRPAQGSVSQRVHPGAEDDQRRRGDAQGYALVLGRRHRPDAIPAVGILQACRRFRRRRPQGHLAFGAGRAGLRRAAARQQGLAAGRALGLRGARAGQCRLHDGRAGSDKTDRRMAARRFRAGARTKSSAPPNRRSRPRCCSPRASTARRS